MFTDSVVVSFDHENEVSINSWILIAVRPLGVASVERTIYATTWRRS
jgi:hypothetical protein